jgi:hypothetical protein
LPAVVLVVLWIAAGTYARATYEPLEAVLEAAERAGLPRDRLASRGGGYEAGLISWSAHGTFALEPPEATDGTPGEPSGELVHVEVVRPTPLHAWRLKRLEHERP